MQKYTILYVDDEESNLQGFESIYFTDYTILTAISGKAALEILKQHEVHIIITDQKMPEMTGVEFLNKVVVKFPEPIRIILTGYSDIEVIIKAINSCGIFRYITKPWKVEEMDLVIKQGLETYNLRKHNKQLIRDLKVANEGLETKVMERTEEVMRQKEDIELKNEKITDSINYARRIQNAMLPDAEGLKKYVKDIFVLFRPRDIVSGDFYWFNEYYGKIIIAAVDCTGHGVPGAFMSMLGAQALNNIVNVKHNDQPDAILNELRKEVRKMLNQESGENKDGMEIALCMYDTDRQTLNFAGAKNPLIYMQDGEMTVLKGDNKHIGGIQKGEGEEPFQNHRIFITEPTTCYIYTDGFQDQFGGERGRKFMAKRLKELLFEIHDKPLAEQKAILEKNLDDWMGDRNQVDDILLIGFKLED